MQVKSRIQGDIDFGKDGRQAGYLRAPLSRNTSGWGVTLIPIVVVKNGDGPTALFTGGVHGDEYEGPIAVSGLARELTPDQVSGRVIMIPAVNPPAVASDTRLSPADGRDMNRCFPGDPAGTISQMIAHYIDTTVLPHVDVMVDLHTAGHSGDSALSTNMHMVSDAALLARTFDVAAAFGAPYNVVFAGVDEFATLTSSAERRGIVTIGTELGGWGRVNVAGVRVARRGIANVLAHLGITQGTAETDTPTRHMNVPGPQNYSFAPREGTFEPCNVVGEVVRKGDIAGYAHRVDEIDTPPLEVRYAASGVLWMSAGPGRVQRGDVVAVVMNDYEG